MLAKGSDAHTRALSKNHFRVILGYFCRGVLVEGTVLLIQLLARWMSRTVKGNKDGDRF